jgi:hypothetical protein
MSVNVVRHSDGFLGRQIVSKLSINPCGENDQLVSNFLYRDNLSLNFCTLNMDCKAKKGEKISEIYLRGCRLSGVKTDWASINTAIKKIRENSDVRDSGVDFSRHFLSRCLNNQDAS